MRHFVTQKGLPFLEAEISSDERFSYLGLALMRVQAIKGVNPRVRADSLICVSPIW